MSKSKGTLKGSLYTILEYKATKYILIGTLMVLPLSFAVSYNYLKNNNSYNNEDLADVNVTEEDLLTKGVVNTDVEDYIDEEVEYSTYTLGKDYSDKEEEIETNSSAPKNSSYTTDNSDLSSLIGNDVWISEGDSFNPLSDLNLKAIDKNGSDISGRIKIEKNDVNANKAGTYTVRASVRLSDGYSLEKSFNVYVKAVELNISIESFKAVEKQVGKNEKATIDLDLKSSKNYVTVSSAMINGHEYQVYKSWNIIDMLLKKQSYKIVINTDSNIGQHEYKLSYLKMSDGTLVNTDNTATIEVLRSNPKITDFAYREEISKKRIYTKFKLSDSDNAASNLKLKVYRNKQLISTEKIDRKDSYELYIPVQKSGNYEVQIIADVNLCSNGSEENLKLNEKIFSETIRIRETDETSLEGKNIEMSKNKPFDVIKDLGLKATDVDGTDITDKIQIQNNNVNVNEAGKYKISVYIVNKYDEKISKTFEVIVKDEEEKKESIENDENKDKNSSNTESLNDENEQISIASYEVKSDFSETESVKENMLSRMMRRIIGDDTDEISLSTNKNSRSTISMGNSNQAYSVVTGDATSPISANVQIDGTVERADGLAADGKLHVELPTKLAFTVDKGGTFTGASYTISNKSSSGIEVYVSKFSDSPEGITVIPLSENLSDKDRSYVHLYLSGDKNVDLGKKAINKDQDDKLVEVNSGSTRIISLSGEAGKQSNQEVDEKGASENFNMILKIKKKN